MKVQEAQRWFAAVVNPNLVGMFKTIAQHLVAPSAQVRYKTVSKETSVPWAVIAVVHEREASQSWAANLAQGDRWDHVSTHVPRHEGPFSSWEEAAIHALTIDAPYLAHWGDWRIGGALVGLKAYNGFGYDSHGIPSPYLWAGTDRYKRGKYTSDGHLDLNAVDHQPGCVGLLKAMAALEPSTYDMIEGATS